MNPHEIAILHYIPCSKSSYMQSSIISVALFFLFKLSVTANERFSRMNSIICLHIYQPPRFEDSGRIEGIKLALE